jgi:hypothetical protein
MQSFVAFHDRSPHTQHRFNHCGKYWITVLKKFSDARFVAPTTNASNQQAICSQRATK